MNIARILYPVEVFGPGHRIGLWLCGCNRACKGCSNPELWQRRPEFELPVSDIMTLIRKIAVSHPVDGFTISGGEPMDQSEELAILLMQLSSISNDILVYSGYTLSELRAKTSSSVNMALHSIAVLIDGQYIEDLNDNSLLRGSANQNIHVLNPAFDSLYKEYLSNTSNRIQNFSTSDGVVSVGIHRKSF